MVAWVTVTPRSPSHQCWLFLNKTQGKLGKERCGKAVAWLWRVQGPRGAQGTYTQGFSRPAPAGCPSMGPLGYRWDARAY